MTTWKLTAKTGDRVQLFSDDTFTFAFGSPNHYEESTPEDLASCFSARVLRGFKKRLALQIGSCASENGKLARALELASTSL